MATYRFRVTFEDHDDVTRDIEIKSTQTFEDLHHAIHSAIGFDASKPASFYMSDDNWKKGKEITTRDLSDEEAEKITPVKKARLCDFIVDPHQKIYYVFELPAAWPFRIELVKINREEDQSITYPRCIKAIGEAPKQYNALNIATLPVPEDFDISGDDIDEDVESEELEVESSDLPEGEEKDTSFINASDESLDDFETADEDTTDDEGGQPSDKDDF